MTDYDVVIVGTGHGGSQAAVSLRQQGFAGTIALIGRENTWPYEKPPLSKDYLSREKAFERILIRPLAFWKEKQIDLLLGAEVTKIDAESRSVTLSGGRKLTFGDLVWSAGGAARKLTCGGSDLAGVHAIREKANVDALMSEIDAGARNVVIIGGGYIGLEAAAVLTKLRCSVILLEALDRVLARVAGTELSRFFEHEHRSHGVDLRLETVVDCLEGHGGRVKGVRLSDGQLLECDMVVVGIGIVPSVDALASCGARISNGVEVDEFCQTSIPHVYATGDCAAHSNPFAGGAIIRLESVQNACDMAVTAAKSICGKPEAYDATPWFWSNQYDLKLQTVGSSQGHDEAVLRGDPRKRSFSVVYLKQGKVIALDCVNAIKDYVQGKKLVEAGVSMTPARLADTTTTLKDLLASYSTAV